MPRLLIAVVVFLYASGGPIRPLGYAASGEEGDDDTNADVGDV